MSSKSAFWSGFGIVGAIATVLLFSVACLNFAAISFGMPISPIADPFIAIYRAVLSLFDIFDNWADWAVPNWNHNITILVWICASVVMRAVQNFSDNPRIVSQGRATKILGPPIFIAVALAIPFVRWLALFWAFAGFVFLLSLPAISNYVERNKIEFHRDLKPFSRMGFFAWGCLASAAVAIFSNLYAT